MVNGHVPCVVATVGAVVTGVVSVVGVVHCAGVRVTLVPGLSGYVHVHPRRPRRADIADIADVKHAPTLPSEAESKRAERHFAHPLSQEILGNVTHLTRKKTHDNSRGSD